MSGVDPQDEPAPAPARPDVVALPPRPRPGDHRRRPEPVRTAAVQAIAGAALSVLAVGLGIVVLNWVNGPQLPSTVRTESGVAAAPLTPQVPATPTPGATPAAPPGATPAATGSAAGAAAGAAAGPADVLSGPDAPAASAPSPGPSASPRPPSLVVPVTVLNNSRRTGLAARASERFRAGGWPVELVGNFRGRIPVTTVYYDPGLQENAQAFARDFDGIVRVRPRFPGLPARGVVVVVTREFAA